MDFAKFVRRHGGNEGIVVDPPPTDGPTVAGDPSYFAYREYQNWIIAHVAIMIIAWVFLLPIAVMLSLARSKLSALGAQFAFLTANAVGLLCGTVYNSNTPDLYPNNAHHKLGWFLTWLATAHTVVGLLRAYTSSSDRQRQLAGDDVAATKSKRPLHVQRGSDTSSRFSRDSGYGIEIESPRDASPTSLPEERRQAEPTPDETDNEEEKHGLLGRNIKVDRYLAQKMRGVGSSRAMGLLNLAYSIVDRFLLLLGFAALASGVVTYGGFFHGNGLFSGLAHFIKGGIFFWYGLFTLGRVMGVFANLGWAWNVKPLAQRNGRWRSSAPSAEFVESFLLFLYGSTNVFLERLGDRDPGPWSSTDLEHVSISIMFFGGGLCGMLLESRRVRSLLNDAILGAPRVEAPHFGDEAYRDEAWQEPRTYGFSMNPLPALIIMLLGIMMSGHHQQSAVSTMMHKQWGRLFTAGALFRGLTYVLTYLAPPTSHFPMRPPSEIVVAFCLISGGLLFMASNQDFVQGMENYGLDAMFLFTLTMGLTAFLMAWEIVVLAVRSWAVRRERAHAFR